MSKWPDTSTFDVPLGDGFPSNDVEVYTLNNIEVIRIQYVVSHLDYGVDVNVGTIDNLITVLQYAKWYLTEGKYNDQTAEK